MSTPQILVVEDDDDLRHELCDALGWAGFSTAQASNGREALDYLAKQPAPRLILLDLIMPVMDGHEFLAARRHNATHALIPVFLFTGFETEQAHERTDVERVFGKPLDLKGVVAAATDVVGR